jgi:hypothetical protein
VGASERSFSVGWREQCTPSTSRLPVSATALLVLGTCGETQLTIPPDGPRSSASRGSFRDASTPSRVRGCGGRRKQNITNGQFGFFLSVEHCIQPLRSMCLPVRVHVHTL